MSLSKSVQPVRFPFPLGVVLLAIVLLGLGLFFFLNQDGPVDFGKDIQGCVSLDRSSYVISPLVFEFLPPPPACFHSVVAAYNNGELKDESFLDESIYLQPEFFPSFASDGLRIWKDPVATHYGAVGYGAHPIRSTLYLSPSNESTSRFFLFSGIGTRSLQQARITYHFLNPADESLVSISLDDASAEGFLLGPTFPQFTPQWVKPVQILVSSSAPLPRAIVVYFRVSPSNVDFSSDPLTQLFPLFDATSYVGERDVFALTISPSS